MNQYQLEKFKKWTVNYMNLPPIVDVVKDLMNATPGKISNETQTITIFVNLHLDEVNQKNLIFVFKDDETILSLKRQLYDKKVNNSLEKIILYNKDFICENLKTLKECKVINNTILDAWLDSAMKITIQVSVKQYDSNVCFTLKVNPYIPFNEFIIGVSEVVFGNYDQRSMDQLATPVFQGQKLIYTDEKTLYELGIKNGSQIKLIMNDKHGCFPPDAPVTMGDGSKKRISEIQVGDQVMSYDLEEKNYKTHKVIYLHYGNAADFILIQTQNKLIKTKPNNPFLTQEGWKAVFPNYKLEIKQLTTQDLILDENFKYNKIISIQNIIEISKVYNITLCAQSVFMAYGFVVLHNNFNAQVKINNQMELLEITSGMMVHNIKGMIQMKHGIKIEEQEIYYDEKKLNDSDLVLEQTNSEYIQLQLKIHKQNQSKKKQEEQTSSLDFSEILLKMDKLNEKLLEAIRQRNQEQVINILKIIIIYKERIKQNKFQATQLGKNFQLYNSLEQFEQEIELIENLLNALKLSKGDVHEQLKVLEEMIAPKIKASKPPFWGQNINTPKIYQPSLFSDLQIEKQLFTKHEQIKHNERENQKLRIQSSSDQIIKIKERGCSQTRPLSYPNDKIQEDTITVKLVSNEKVVKLKIKQHLDFKKLCRIIQKYINLQNTEKQSILYKRKMYEVANQGLDKEDLKLQDNTTLILLTENQILSAFQFTYYLLNQIQLNDISGLIESLKYLGKSSKVNLFIQKEIEKINNDTNKKTLYQQFKLHHLLAIKIQTSNLVYKELNIDLRSNQFHQKWSGYLKCLMQATRYCQYYQGVTFRGFKDYQNTEIYQVGKILQWSEISASTKDIQIAEQFTNNQGMLFETELISAKDIENLSIYESEKEVLILPFSCFSVTSVRKLDNQPIYVKLRELPLPRSSQILLWIDDQPQNNYQYVQKLQKENLDISVVFCTSTKEAFNVIQKYRFMIYLDDTNVRIVTDMVRHEEGRWDYEAGIKFLKYMIDHLKYDYQVLVFCGDVKKAKQSCMKLQIFGNYIISNQEAILNSFIRFQ